MPASSDEILLLHALNQTIHGQPNRVESPDLGVLQKAYNKSNYVECGKAPAFEIASAYFPENYSSEWGSVFTKLHIALLGELGMLLSNFGYTIERVKVARNNYEFKMSFNGIPVQAVLYAADTNGSYSDQSFLTRLEFISDILNHSCAG